MPLILKIVVYLQLYEYTLLSSDNTFQKIVDLTSGKKL